MSIRTIAACSRIFWGRLSFAKLSYLFGPRFRERLADPAPRVEVSRPQRVEVSRPPRDVCDIPCTRPFPHDGWSHAGLVELPGDAPTPDNHLRVIEAIEHPRIVDIPADHVAGRLDRLA